MGKDEFPSGRINLPGVSADLGTEIEVRIEEFEREHGEDLARDGPGWVPRVRRLDYVVAGLVTAGLVVWLLVVVLTA